MSTREPNNINLSVIVSASLQAQIQAFAKRNNYRMSSAIRRLVELGLEREFYSRQAE